MIWLSAMWRREGGGYFWGLCADGFLCGAARWRWVAAGGVCVHERQQYRYGGRFEGRY